MGSLVKYDAACRALAEAKSADEVRQIRDLSEAMRAYARQAKNKGLEIDAAEIRIRAERRLGELLAASPKAKGNRGTLRGRDSSGGAVLEPPETKDEITLAEAGIDKKLSSRARKLAAVPEEEFEGELGEWRERVSEEGRRVTTRLEEIGERAARRECAIGDDLIVSISGVCPTCGQDIAE